MNAPIYTPFFIHPAQKKRLQRKKNGSNNYEQYSPILDARSRRPGLANGNGEWSLQVQAQDIPSVLHSRNKRTRSVIEHNEQSEIKVDIEEGLHEVAAEVEVNVEDDSSDPISTNSSQPKRLYSSDGPFNSTCTTIPSSGNFQLPASSTDITTFDPDSCNDIAELRSRLYNAYDRVDHLNRINVNQNRLKQENFYLKNEVNKRDIRVAQLESIVLERNLRLKQLLSENVLMSARIKKIQSEFGVDAVKEIFNRDKV